MIMVVKMYFLKLKTNFSKSFFLILIMNVQLFKIELKTNLTSFLSNVFCLEICI